LPRATGTTFGDLVGKLTVLVVECPKSRAAARSALRRLIEIQRGRDASVSDRCAVPRPAEGGVTVQPGCPLMRSFRTSNAHREYFAF
jgi:hypothetical protein